MAKKQKEFSGKEIEELKKDDPCWTGYKQIGNKDKGGKKVPNCVPETDKEDDEDDKEEIVPGDDMVKGKGDDADKEKEVVKPAKRNKSNEASYPNKDADDDDDEADDEDEDDGDDDGDQSNESEVLSDEEFKTKCHENAKQYFVKPESLNSLKQILPEGLSDTFFDDFNSIILGLINEKIENVFESLFIDMSNVLHENVEAIESKFQENIETMIDVEIEKFKEQHKDNIVSSIKVEQAIKLMNSIKDIMKEYGHVEDDTALSKVKESEDKVLELEGQIKENYEVIKSLKAKLSDQQIQLEMVDIMKGMSETDKQRLKTMLGEQEKDNVSNYIKEAMKVRDFILGDNQKSTDKNAKCKVDEVDLLTENDEQDDDALSVTKFLRNY